MKYLITILLTVVLTTFTFTQVIKAGVSVGGNIYQNTKVSLPIYFPDNTYLTIIEENKGQGILNSHNAFNGYFLGGIITGFYKKFSFTVEPQFMYKYSHLEFKTPSTLNWSLLEKGFRMPMYFSYRLTKSTKSIELLTGLTLFKTNTIDFQTPGFSYLFLGDDIYSNNIYYGRNIFKDVLYNNQSYMMFLIGFKKPLKKWDMTIKFQSYLNSQKYPIEAKYFQFEIGFSRYIFNSDFLTNKHYLYVE